MGDAWPMASSTRRAPRATDPEEEERRSTCQERAEDKRCLMPTSVPEPDGKHTGWVPPLLSLQGVLLCCLTAASS